MSSALVFFFYTADTLEELFASSVSFISFGLVTTETIRRQFFFFYERGLFAFLFLCYELYIEVQIRLERGALTEGVMR